MTLCCFMSWWSLESGVCLPQSPLKEDERDGATVGWRVLQVAVGVPVMAAGWGTRLCWHLLSIRADGDWNSFPKKRKTSIPKNKCFIGLFFLLSSSITPTHTHIHTWGSQSPNISFWSFYSLKKADILWKFIQLCDSNNTAFSISGFGLQIFLHSLVILVIFSLSIAIIRMRKNVFPEVEKPQLWQGCW